MTVLVDSLRGRVFLSLVFFLSLSHLVALWLYVRKSDEATTLLHDALLAEQIALVTRVADRLPEGERAAMMAALSGPLLRIREGSVAGVENAAVPEASRAATFEHLLAVFLGRQNHEKIRLAYSSRAWSAGAENLLGTVQASAHGLRHDLPSAVLAEIRPIGVLSAGVALRDGSWLTFTAPFLTVMPYSFVKIGPTLAAMLISVLVAAAWVLHRWTGSLTRLARAATRIGGDIHAPALAETGPSEVRAAAAALNRMQERIRRLLEDRTALAASIAHDLGTPVTRLHLRLHELEESEFRTRALVDLEQMRAMIRSTLDFARMENSAEASETIELGSLLQSIAHDFTDAGKRVVFEYVRPTMLQTKPISLRRALSNIIDNAIKYGSEARISLDCKAGTGEVRIKVEDEGPGIAEDQMEAAFQPFRRLVYAKNVEGAGLGLSIARSVVRGLGGDIVLRNNGGLVVTIVLPVGCSNRC